MAAAYTRVFQVRILRSLLLVLIAAVSLAVVVNYLHTSRQRRTSVRPAGQMLAPELARSAESIEYGSWEEGVLKFRVRAKKVLEDKQGVSILQGISANNLNPDGSIRNEITSQNGEYDAVGKKIRFYGDVRLRLSQGVEIRMKSLRYSIGEQLGTSDETLQLVAAQAEGTARGVWYDNAGRNLELLNDLSFVVHRPVIRPDGSRTVEDYLLKSERGTYSEQEQLFRLVGGANITSAGGILSGDRIEATFTNDRRRLTSLSSHGNARYESKAEGDTRSLRGEHIDFNIGKESQVLENIHALGKAGFQSTSAAANQDLTADEFYLVLDPVRNQPVRIEGKQNVHFTVDRAQQRTEISGRWLEAAFVPGQTALESMTVLDNAAMKINMGPGSPDELQAGEIRIAFKQLDGRSVPREFQADRAVEWKSPGRSAKEAGRSLTASSLVMQYAPSGEYLESGKALGSVVLAAAPKAGASGTQIQRLQTDRADFTFFPGDNRLHTITAKGSVRVSYRSGNPEPMTKPEEFTTTSDTLAAEFREADGGIVAARQTGRFTYRDAQRSAQSSSCDFVAASETMTLTGSPEIRDSDSSSSSGEIVEYDLKGKVLTIRRNVRSVFKSGSRNEQGGFGVAGSSLAVITADELLLWKDQDRAKYSGRVRMSSPESQLQSDVLVIENKGETMDAEGKVRHFLMRFGDAAADAPGNAGLPAPANKSTTPRIRGPVDIRCTRLHYARSLNLIHYEGSVFLDSPDAKMNADVMDAYFTADGKGLDHAKVTGNVRIKQAGRDIAGKEGEFFPAEGRFVVRGNAGLTDAARGVKMSGRQLTFYTANDRIEVIR